MKKLLTVCILTSGSVYTNISGQQEGQIKTERTSRKEREFKGPMKLRIQKKN